MVKHTALAGCIVLLGTFLVACGPGYGGGGYYARYAPPAPRYGVVGIAPGPGYVWTNGYWNWRGRDWGWVEGRWVRPPRSHARWVQPEWRHEGNGWRLHRGYWR